MADVLSRPALLPRPAARAAREDVGKIESAEIHVRTALSARLHRPRPAGRHAVFRIEAVLIVHLLLLRIAQNIVGFLNLLEAILGRFIARIQIRMMFAREFAVGFADVVFAGAALDAEGLIVIGLGHKNQESGARSQESDAGFSTLTPVS